MTPELKITVYIYLHPPHLRLVFPTSHLAAAYHHRCALLKPAYLLSPWPTTSKSSEVLLRLPSSVRKFESSRSLGGFVLYFTHATDAVRFSDPVMCRVAGEADLLVIKQYWPVDELEHALRPPRLVAFDRGRARDRSRRRGQSGSRHDDRDRGRDRSRSRPPGKHQIVIRRSRSH